MDFQEVLGKANQILDEERTNPTVSYEKSPNAAATPTSAVYFEGNGANVIYVDWEDDIVAVVRWISGGSALNDFVAKMLASITDSTTRSTMIRSSVMSVVTVVWTTASASRCATSSSNATRSKDLPRPDVDKGLDPVAYI